MSVPSPASERTGTWRVALFALAVGSLGPLWWISGARWGGEAGREELARARLAHGAGRHEEAWVRAER
ncbi:MAG: hypothetical protein HUU15_19570, partial [Candidatus Brocadiae bacterium]|nr:hypothetical protein [Candidatus Brocadiia bacterium]